MIFTIEQHRIGYKPQSTLGEVILPVPRIGRFCYTLEDTVRGDGIKVAKFTAIPALKYNVGIRYSNSFKRDVLVLYTKIIERNGYKEYVIEHNGITFTYVLVHGGNTIHHSDACILVAYNAITNEEEYKIQLTVEKDLFDIVSSWIKAGDTVYWNITNKSQKS
ncbi:hypothetical protein GW932_02985 [archaeon]|nr:hypothetical protein [archaeon]